MLITNKPETYCLNKHCELIISKLSIGASKKKRKHNPYSGMVVLMVSFQSKQNNCKTVG